MKRIIGIIIGVVIFIGLTPHTNAIQTNNVDSVATGNPPLVGQTVDSRPPAGVEINKSQISTRVKNWPNLMSEQLGNIAVFIRKDIDGRIYPLFDSQTFGNDKSLTGLRIAIHANLVDGRRQTATSIAIVEGYFDKKTLVAIPIDSGRISESVKLPIQAIVVYSPK